MIAMDSPVLSCSARLLQGCVSSSASLSEHLLFSTITTTTTTITAVAPSCHLPPHSLFRQPSCICSLMSCSPLFARFPGLHSLISPPLRFCLFGCCVCCLAVLLGFCPRYVSSLSSPFPSLVSSAVFCPFLLSIPHFISCLFFLPICPFPVFSLFSHPPLYIPPSIFPSFFPSLVAAAAADGCIMSCVCLRALAVQPGCPSHGCRTSAAAAADVVLSRRYRRTGRVCSHQTQ